MTDKVWGQCRLLWLEANRITSVFNPVSPLTLLWQIWSLKHKDLENEKYFPEMKEKKKKSRAVNKGNEEAMTGPFIFPSGLSLPGTRATNPLCQMLQMGGHHPLFPQRSGNHSWAKAFQLQDHSKHSLRKLKN